MMQASIITIGDELLIGQVIDTNSAWMAQELNKIGIGVIRRVAVGDVWNNIWAALDEEQKYADIILITGGLGPTADDITKPLLCQYFNGKMILNEDVQKNILNIFSKTDRPIIDRNLQQAQVPDNCKVLLNTMGTAPGMWFEKDKKIFISMPGIPHEMKSMMEFDVIPALKKKFRLPCIRHCTLLTAGIGESFLAERIKDFENDLPAHIKLAYLPNYGMVRLRLSGMSFNKETLEGELQQLFKMLQSLVTEYLVTNSDEPIEKVVAKLLLQKNKTISTAESCTGGYIAHLLTSIPGSSKFYNGSIVSYSNKVKENILQVDHDILEKKGAVSEDVVIQMAKNTLKNIQSDYVIAVSGIMGPDGGSPDKPVGTVWIAFGSVKKIETKKLLFKFNRQQNIQSTAVAALDLLRRFIILN